MGRGQGGHSDWQRALGFTERCSVLSNIEDVGELLRQTVTPLGYDYLIASRLEPFDREPFPAMIIARHWPEGWYERYMKNNFFVHDPVARRIRQSLHPFRWSDVLDEVRENRCASRVLEIAAADHRLRDGICVPLHGLHGLQGAVSMGGEHVDASKQALAFLHLVTVFAGTQMHKILSTDSKASGLLSRREREVLLWAANGKSAAETASVMNLAVSTIDKQIASAIRKLGSCTKTQAVAKALWAREIRL